jgi:hypothetical protein
MSVRIVELREGSEEVVERRAGRKSVLVAREDIIVWKKDTIQSISPAFVFPKPTNRNALTQSGSGRITGPAKGILYCISCNLTLSV